MLEGAKRGEASFDAATNTLAAQGATFKVYINTLVAHDIPASSVFPWMKIVPSGVVEVALAGERGLRLPALLTAPGDYNASI